jgi:hypothetical protein
VCDIALKMAINRGVRSALLLFAFCSTSCRNEDRILTVTCGPPPGERISVDMQVPSALGKSVGLVNTHQLVPGTILRSIAPREKLDSHGGTAPYRLRISGGDFLPLSAEPWWGKVVSARFGIELDDDVRNSTAPFAMELERQVIANTELVIAGARRSTLRDPLGLINADRDAVRLMQNAGVSVRFAVVSAVTYGGAVGLYDLNYSSAPSIAANTVEVKNVYLHVRFSCSTLDTLNTRVELLKTQLPILFFYMPLKFDRTSGIVKVDTVPLDPSTIDVAVPPLP